MSYIPQLLIDTDVMIEYLRGAAQAITFLESLERRPATSVICLAELFAGARNAQEQEAIEAFLQAFEILPVDTDIAQLGGHYRKTYLKSHGTGLADALIAATATNHNLTLATFNITHYPMLETHLPYPRG